MNSNTTEMSNPFWMIFIGFSITGGIILASFGTALYVKAKDDENLFRPWKTTCLLLDYKSLQHICKSCGDDDCTIYTCYNQIYQITYHIYNGTYINSTIVINDKQNQQEMKIGENYTCYYDKLHDVTFVKWKYDDDKKGLIMLCVGCGIVGINISVIAFISINHLFRKLHEKWLIKSKDIITQMYQKSNYLL